MMQEVSLSSWAKDPLDTMGQMHLLTRVRNGFDAEMFAINYIMTINVAFCYKAY